MKIEKIFFHGNGHFDERCKKFRESDLFKERHCHREGIEPFNDPKCDFSWKFYEAETMNSGRILRVRDDNYIECSLFGSEYFAAEVIGELKWCGFQDNELKIETEAA